MTGIDRLRTLAGAWDEWGLGGSLTEIADEIGRELREERERWDDDLSEAQVSWNAVAGVCLDMERHCLGHEGMEDSPVARWARELREALGGAVTDEDRDAAEWVRKRGGLDHVRVEWNEHVPRDLYQRRRWRLLGHIAECETALGRRREIISKLTHRVSDLTNENAELRRRAMPEGMEWLLEVWPRWSNGEYCRFGDWWKSDKYGEDEPKKFRKLSIYTPEQLDEWEQGDGESYGYEWDFMRPSELDYRPDKVEPPEPVDTWERIEEDARGLDSGVDRELFTHTHEDIVRRCRALAERERGE